MIVVFSNINRSDKLEIKGIEVKKNSVVWINYCDIGKYVLLGLVIICDYVNVLVFMYFDKFFLFLGIFIMFIVKIRYEY